MVMDNLPIEKFRGEYMFLSNFYLAVQAIEHVIYPSNEHFFAAQKCLDVEKHMAIVNAPTPGIAKKMGSKKGYKMPNGQLFRIELRPGWDNIKDDIMMFGLDLKYTQHPDLLKKLISTYPRVLIEGNEWHDNYWGNCTCSKCTYITGLNKLGLFHMMYRNKYINEGG